MTRRAFSYARQPAPEPRNAAEVIAQLALCDGRFLEQPLIVSYIGATSFDGLHVYVDSGQRYDWRFAADLQLCIVVRPGVDSRRTMADIFRATRPYPTLVDFDRKLVGSLVDGADGGLKLWPRRRGGEPWRAIFE